MEATQHQREANTSLFTLGLDFSTRDKHSVRHGESFLTTIIALYHGPFVLYVQVLTLRQRAYLSLRLSALLPPLSPYYLYDHPCVGHLLWVALLGAWIQANMYTQYVLTYDM